MVNPTPQCHSLVCLLIKLCSLERKSTNFLPEIDSCSHPLVFINKMQGDVITHQNLGVSGKCSVTLSFQGFVLFLQTRRVADLALVL